jgi:hypothetical protein
MQEHMKLNSKIAADGRMDGMTVIVPRGGFQRMPIFKKTDNKEAIKREKERKFCCWPQKDGSVCGTISFYYVGRSGFCEEHKAEAYYVQAKYWNNKVRNVEAVISKAG